MAQQLRVGVVGVGSLGYHHARLLKRIPDAELVGIHDTDRERLSTVSAELESAAFADRDRLLERCDAAVIAVPTVAHEEVACRAIAHGAHVLIEKPIAATLDEADRILAAADAAGVLVQIGHVERFNGALRACEPFLEAPLFVESHRLAPFAQRGTDVPVVLDLMIHDVDLVLSLVGRAVTGIAAVGVPVLSTSPDIANARLEFDGGCVANLTASRVSLERMRKIRFFQRSGYISLDLAAGRGAFLRLRDGLVFSPGAPLEGLRIEDVVQRVPLESDGVEPLRAELESFVAAALGRGAVMVPGREAREALAVALDIVDRIEKHVTDRHPA